jgi:hypothetical protein
LMNNAEIQEVFPPSFGTEHVSSDRAKTPLFGQVTQDA